MVLGERPDELIARRERQREQFPELALLDGDVGMALEINAMRTREGRELTPVGQSIMEVERKFDPNRPPEPLAPESFPEQAVERTFQPLTAPQPPSPTVAGSPEIERPTLQPVAPIPHGQGIDPERQAADRRAFEQTQAFLANLEERQKVQQAAIQQQRDAATQAQTAAAAAAVSPIRDLLIADPTRLLDLTPEHAQTAATLLSDPQVGPALRQRFGAQLDAIFRDRGITIPSAGLSATEFALRGLQPLETVTNVGAGILRSPIEFASDLTGGVEADSGFLSGESIRTAVSRAEERGQAPTPLRLRTPLGELDIGREVARGFADPLNILAAPLGFAPDIARGARAIGRDVATGARLAVPEGEAVRGAATGARRLAAEEAGALRPRRPGGAQIDPITGSVIDPGDPNVILRPGQSDIDQALVRSADPDPALTRPAPQRTVAADRPPEPSEVLDRIISQRTPGEKPNVTLMRRFQAALNTAENEARIIVDEGSEALESIGLGARVRGRLAARVEDIPQLDELQNALHNASRVESGEIVLSPELRSHFDRLRELTNWEESARIDFNPEMATVEDYFFRGWKPPEGMFTDTGQAIRGRVGAVPTFKKPRVNATYQEMRDLGFEPLFWNPYEQWRVARLQGIRYRTEMQLIDDLKATGQAVPHTGGPTPADWRTPRIGPAFEGKPFAFLDATGEEAAEEAMRVGFTRRWIVPDELAKRLENIFSITPNMGKIHVGGRAIDLLNVINVAAFLPKRAKLFGSFFQQQDFLTRLAVGGFTGAVDALQAGKPLSAVRRLAVIPKAGGEVLAANFSPSVRANLRRTLNSTAPIVPERPGIHFRGIMEAGLSTIDVTLLPKDLDTIAREVAEETGLLGTSRKVAKLVTDFESTTRRGLFEGVYPASQIADIRNNIAPMIIRQFPNETDAQIMGRIARITNIKYSTIPASQSVFQNQVLRAFLARVFFSVGESEGLLRQAIGTVQGGNKAFFAKHWLGAYTFLIATANAIHFASTGEPLPVDRYTPIAKDGFGPLPIGYNRDFASPNIPIQDRGGKQLRLDIVGQLDTVFRTLDPVSFFTSRESVPVRAIQNQVEGQDFLGNPIDTVGPGGIVSRTFQLMNDLFAPIGPGQSALSAARETIPGAGEIIPESEARIGLRGLAVQAPGLNVRAITTPQLRDEKAREFATQIRPKSPGSIQGWDDLTRAEQTRIRELDPDFAAELDRRRETAGVRDPLRQAQNEVSDQRNADIRQAAKDFVNDGEGFRRAVSDIAAEARAQSTLLTDLRGLDFDPTNEIQTNTSRWFDLFDQSEIEARETGELASDAFNRLEGELIREIGEDAYRKVLENVYTVTDLDAPELFQQLQATKFDLATEGFWDLRADAWQTYTDLPEGQQFVSIAAYRRDLANQARARFNPGVPETTIQKAIANRLRTDPLNQAFNRRLNILEAEWIAAGGRAQLADNAVKFGYLNPTKQQAAIIRNRLSEETTVATAPTAALLQ